MIFSLIAPGVTGITGWYDNKLVVPGVRHSIREHSSTYVWEYRVSTGYQSITCLLRTGITHKYAFIFSYLAQGASAVVVVVEKMIKIKVGGKAKKSKKIAPKRIGM